MASRNKPVASRDELPSDSRAFAALVKGLRTEDTRGALYDRIIGEFPGYAGLFKEGPRPPAGAGTANGRLLESRLLAFTREPIVLREFGRHLSFAQSNAWTDLTRMRSPAFSRRLAGWVCSDDRLIAGEAATHLAWRGRARSLPLLRKIAASGKAHMVEGVAQGTSLAALHRHAEPGFAGVLADALIPFIAGERPVRGIGDARWEAYSEIVDLLIQTKGREALGLLCSGRALRGGNPALRTVLVKLWLVWEDNPASVRRAVDAAAAWSAFEAVRGSRGPHRDAMLGQVLILGALADPVRAMREAKALRAAGVNEALGQYLKSVAKVCRGIPEPSALVHRRGRLKDRAAAVITAYELVMLVNGDGLLLYFHNMGHAWKQAHRGLEEIGQTRPARLLAAAAKIAFGGTIVDSAGAARRVFNALPAAQIAKLEAACEAYEEASGGVTTAVEAYIGRRPEMFRV